MLWDRPSARLSIGCLSHELRWAIGARGVHRRHDALVQAWDVSCRWSGEPGSLLRLDGACAIVGALLARKHCGDPMSS